MPADVIILSGPPGAGKSTVAALLARTFERGVHLRSDGFWHAVVSGGIPPFLDASREQNETVLRAVAAAAHAYAAGGFTVVVDGVVGPWMLDRFTGSATSSSRVHYVVLRPKRRVALARATARTGELDLVDEVPVGALWQQFDGLGPLERHVVDSTGQSADETCRVVRGAVDRGSHVVRGG